MKEIYGLTPRMFVYAVITGMVLACIAISANAPHPVSAPVQVITPVPTPPPVVIDRPIENTFVVSQTIDNGLQPVFIVAVLAMFFGMVGFFAFVTLPKSQPEQFTTWNTCASSMTQSLNSTPFEMFSMAIFGAIVIVCAAVGWFIMEKA
jgi:hypothetical protein